MQCAAADRLLTAFETWLEADRQHAAGAAPAALYPLFQRAAELLTDRELVALLLGNAAEMLLRCGRWDEATVAALESSWHFCSATPPKCCNADAVWPVGRTRP